MLIAKWIIERTLRIQAIEDKSNEVTKKLQENKEESERILKKLNGAVKGATATLAEK